MKSLTLLVASVLAFALTTVGCASLTGAVAPQVARAVTKYCAEPLAERLVIREQVNGMITPATIKVTCPGDPAQ